MKRLLACILSLIMVVSFSTVVLGESAFNLDDMTLDELKALRNQIDEKISALEGTSDSETNGGFKERVIETDDGILVIKGYSIIPRGFKGYSNDHKYDNYSIFTVHATLTVKGNEPKSSWSTFHTQAYQKGIDSRRHTDFSKAVSITTDILPNSPVDIDLDFLVETPTDPITFIIETWGRSKIVFQEVIELDGKSATPAKK